MNTIHSHPQKHRNSDNYSRRKRSSWLIWWFWWSRTMITVRIEIGEQCVGVSSDSLGFGPCSIHCFPICIIIRLKIIRLMIIIIILILINTFITVITLTFIDIFILINLLRSTDSPIFRIHFGWNSKNLHSTPKLWFNVRRSCKINQNQRNIFIFIGPSPIIAVDSCH